MYAVLTGGVEYAQIGRERERSDIPGAFSAASAATAFQRRLQRRTPLTTYYTCADKLVFDFPKHAHDRTFRLLKERTIWACRMQSG